MVAIKHGDIDQVVSLISLRGADIHNRDNNGQTALYWACRYGDIAIATLLIDREADVNSRDNDGQTALHRACHNGKKAIAILLIKKKVDIHFRNNRGKTPLDLMPEWRAELTELYDQVNRAWLARKAFLFVLIGGGHVDGSGGGPAGKRRRDTHQQLRDDVLRNLLVSIISFL